MNRHVGTVSTLRLLSALLLLILPAVVEAQSYTNNYGVWNYRSTNGTVTIAGYSGPGGDVSIPASINGLPVTSLADEAFFGDISLTNVTIPNGVTSVGGNAFADCHSLVTVAIPNSVTNLGFAAFTVCSSLASVIIPARVTTINDYTFFDCGALTNVTIPSGVTSIGPVAFLACFSLTTVIIPDSVTDITEEAFEECTNLTTITIPKGVTAIGLREFFDCTKLTSVYFKGNAPTVGDLAFAAGVPSQDPATVYYLPGTTGWGSTLGGLPTRLWNPQVQPGSFGIRTNQFGFNITGSSNLVVVIEASTNLLNPSWYPLQTNTLNGNSLHFADPQWTNYPSRFYRLSMP